MRYSCLVLIGALLAVARAAVADVPSTQPTIDDGPIACTTMVRSIRAGMGNFAVEPGQYHYRIVLPAGYADRPDETVPCLFVFSPSGNARLGNAAGWIGRNRWAAVLLVESRNGPTGPILGNFLAAYDDVTKRYHVQPGMLFATGQSGGARSASLCVELRPGFAGLVLQSAGWWLPTGTRPSHTFRAVNPAMAVYGLFGNRDMNRAEAITLRHNLPANTPYRWDIFTGGHQWAPPDSADRALAWLDRQAILHGTPSALMRDYVFRRAKADLAIGASAAATPWERFAALDRVREMAAARSLGSKVDLRDVTRRLADLSTDPTVQKEHAAKVRLDAIDGAEQAVRAKPASSAVELQAAAATAVAGYRQLATDAPDTVAGDEANRLANDRANERQ